MGSMQKYSDLQTHQKLLKWKAGNGRDRNDKKINHPLHLPFPDFLKTKLNYRLKNISKSGKIDTLAESTSALSLCLSLSLSAAVRKAKFGLSFAVCADDDGRIFFSQTWATKIISSCGK